MDFIVKWNPRVTGKGDSETYMAELDLEPNQAFDWVETRPGKRRAVFCQTVETQFQERSYTWRRVMRVTEERIDKEGQPLLLPKMVVEGWTSLEIEAGDIIKLYEQHGTSEQFHSEFKTDLDMERFPLGKFDTNDLVLAAAALAYNILRIIGQMSLVGDLMPSRHRAKRRRLKTDFRTSKVEQTELQKEVARY